MTIARRSLLRAGAGAVFSAPFASLARAGVLPAVSGKVRKLKLDNLHTGEKLVVDYFVDGQYQPDALQAINQNLRDYRNGAVHVIDPRLLDLLHELNARLETQQPFEVISGFRSPATNAMLHERSSGVASKSLHPLGMAVDIRIPGRGLDMVHANALSMARGGVGLYPSSDFVHVDVGRVRRWNGV